MGVKTIMRSKPLAALTTLLMLHLGIIDRHDYDQPHLHVDSEPTGPTNSVISPLGRIRVDSGVSAANVKTGTIGLLKGGINGLNVVTSYDVGESAGLRPMVLPNTITPA